jgi:hypothetical protein
MAGELPCPPLPLLMRHLVWLTAPLSRGRLGGVACGQPPDFISERGGRGCSSQVSLERPFELLKPIALHLPLSARAIELHFAWRYVEGF